MITCPPGKGAIAWRELLQLLAAQRFGGSIILELSPAQSLQATLEGAAEARQFLRLAMRSL